MPAKIAGAKFEEIRYAAVQEPVEQVSRRSSRDQGDAGLALCPSHVPRKQQPDEQNNYGYRTQYQQERDPLGSQFRKQAESDSRILAVNEIREIGDERPPEALGREPFDGIFSGAIGCHDRHRQPEPARARGGHQDFAPAVPSAPSISLRAATQRSQMVGQSALSPTLTE